MNTRPLTERVTSDYNDERRSPEARSPMIHSPPESPIVYATSYA